VESFGSTLHWGPWGGADPYTLTHATYTLPTGDLSDGFHVYGLWWNSTRLQTYIDDPANVVLDVDMSSQSFFERGGWAANPAIDNPWRSGSNAAPFDSRFYIVINLAVGGTGGYFPDGVGNKPWTDASANAVNDFYAAQPQWYATWPQTGGAGAGSPFIVDYVRVWQDDNATDFTFRPSV